MMVRMGVLACLVAFYCAAPSCAETVSLESLLEEMTNRDRLARWPQPSYTCRQFSSYDRDAVGVDQPGWFANWDRSQFLREEENEGRKEHVLMDTKGPGAVVRFWATWHGPRGKQGLKEFSNGTLRVYLDGNAQPAIQGPIADLIDGGGLAGPPLSQGVSPLTEYRFRGHNIYLPIPYAEHCKITYETSAPIDRGAKTGEALYYQINYRTYSPGTQVESFCTDQLKALGPQLEAVQKRLLKSGREVPKNQKRMEEVGPLAPGESHTLAIDGPGAIREVSLKLNAENQAQALRSTVLEITFDGERTVWCPVGALFGIGYKMQPYRTWYTEVTEEGHMFCYWVMPFANSCELTLHNLGEQVVQVDQGSVQSTPWEWDDRSMHFHATWRQYTKLDTQGRKGMDGDRAFDANFVTVKGQGVFVGDTLSVFNGASAWWGEGDEKIFVDGEAFPSHFGTGSEDYYGYAWCKPAFFAAPFHAQPSGDGNLTVGFTVNSRYRALDAIPFTKSFQFDMEMWHWAGTHVNYAPATFWYARPTAICNVEPDAKTAARPVALRREDVVEVFRAKGALEGESLKVAEKTGGTHEVQEVSQFRWSEDRQLWWRDGNVGDTLTLEFPVPKAGKYQVFACLTKAVDYGIVEVRINDTRGVTFDRFHPRVDHDKLELGIHDLKQGPNRLVVEIKGANDAAIKKHMFGLDYLQLVPAP
ncbi:MAG: glycoside hydrolase family 172 protein [Pirellulaceae bacterium]